MTKEKLLSKEVILSLLYCYTPLQFDYPVIGQNKTSNFVLYYEYHSFHYEDLTPYVLLLNKTFFGESHFNLHEAIGRIVDFCNCYLEHLIYKIRLSDLFAQESVDRITALLWNLVDVYEDHPDKIEVVNTALCLTYGYYLRFDADLTPYHQFKIVWDDEPVPTESGIYCYYSANPYKVYYIGQTTNLRQRLMSHYRQPEIDLLSLAVDMKLAFYKCQERDLLEKERELIEKLNPILNGKINHLSIAS